MGIKKYIFFAILLIALCGLYVYTFQSDNFALDILGIHVNLPVALWVVLPMVILMILSVFHMSFYGMKAFFIRQSLKKDQAKFILCAKDALLGNPHEAEFKTTWFDLPNNMLRALKDPKQAIEILENESLKKICEDIQKVYNGEVVNLKNYKLDPSNPLVIQNILNKLEDNPIYALKTLQDPTQNNENVYKKAFEVLINKASYTEIRKLGKTLTPEQIQIIIQRKQDQKDKLFMEESELLDLLLSIQMSEEEYMSIAKNLHGKLNPEALVNLFEQISNKHHKALKSYIYILFELQMLDKARDILAQSDEKEYTYFKQYLYLKDHNQNPNIELFSYGKD